MGFQPKSQEHVAQDPAQQEKMEKQIEAASAGNVQSLENKIRDQLHKQVHMRIRIPSGRSEVDRSPVPVGLNGVHYLIQRDKEVIVPKGVVNVLLAAQEEVPVVEEHGGQRTVHFTKAQRIPVTILGECEPPENPFENGRVR